MKFPFFRRKAKVSAEHFEARQFTGEWVTITDVDNLIERNIERSGHITLRFKPKRRWWQFWKSPRSVVQAHRYEGGCWFRVFGFGLSFRDSRTHIPLFSERYGYRKIVYVGKWKVEFLKPS